MSKLSTRGSPCPQCGCDRTVLIVEQHRDGRGRLRLRCLVCRFTESKLYRMTVSRYPRLGKLEGGRP